MNWRRYFWPVVGIAAVIFSLLLLWHELRGISLDDVRDGLAAIPTRGWILAALSSVIAYAALAGYDHIALLHIGKRVSWLFVTLCSFTTYALSHNIGGSVFSGAVIRYRAYGTRGLSGQDVGVLVAICWITFVLSTILAAGLVLVFEPEIIDRFSGIAHRLQEVVLVVDLDQLVGRAGAVAIHLRPLDIGIVDMALQPAARRFLEAAFLLDARLQHANAGGARLFRFLGH